VSYRDQVRISIVATLLEGQSGQSLAASAVRLIAQTRHLLERRFVEVTSEGTVQLLLLLSDPG
jgi:hypothetical protein